MALMAACSDDDTFTTSRSNLLSFQTDTLRLDTTFSNVPTSTKTFWVYNRSGDGLRLNSVRLEQGNQTGFRVNVDGVELTAANGYQANGLEVRDKDSIRVFVEMTSPRNNVATPQLLTDNLAFTLESGVQQKVNLRIYSWDAELVKGRKITSNITLTGTRPIVFQDTLKVEAGATLTIPAGMTVYFSNKAAIDVYGTLHCEGTADKPVTLRGDRLDKLFPYLPYDRVSGQWHGIRLHKDSYDNSLTHTDIHSAYDGILCDTATTERTKLTLANSTVHNCQGYGLQAINCKIEAYNTRCDADTLHVRPVLSIRRQPRCGIELRQSQQRERLSPAGLQRQELPCNGLFRRCTHGWQQGEGDGQLPVRPLYSPHSEARQARTACPFHGCTMGEQQGLS